MFFSAVLYKGLSTWSENAGRYISKWPTCKWNVLSIWMGSNHKCKHTTKEQSRDRRHFWLMFFFSFSFLFLFLLLVYGVFRIVGRQEIHVWNGKMVTFTLRKLFGRWICARCAYFDFDYRFLENELRFFLIVFFFHLRYEGCVGADNWRSSHQSIDANTFSWFISTKRNRSRMESFTELAADPDLLTRSWWGHGKFYNFRKFEFISIVCSLFHQLLLVRTPCPRYYEAVDEVLELPEVKKVLDENKQLFAELTEHTGLTIQTPDDVQSLYGTLRAESEYGLELPEWTNEYYPHRLENLTELSYIYNIYTEEMKKVKAGPFLKKLSTEFEAKRNETIKPAERKISLYCGHDSTVVNILSGLNVWKQQMPVYGIMTLIELVRDRSTDEIGVQIYLRTSSKRSAIPLVIPGCDHFCPLDKFIQICQRVIPEEGEAICKPRNQYYVTPAMSGP